MLSTQRSESLKKARTVKTMFIPILTAFILFLGIASHAYSDPAAKPPVIHEALKSAARARIGERGLYVASVTQLADGNLLACAHSGSSEAQRLSVWLSNDLGGTWKQIQNKGDVLFGRGATLKTLKDGSVLLHTGVLYRSENNGLTWGIVDCPDVGLVRSIVEQADGTLFLFGSESSWYAGLEPPPPSLLGPQKQWYREKALQSVAIHTAWRLSSNDGGRSWSQPQTVMNNSISIKNDTNWYDLQSFFSEASIVAVGPSHLLAAARRSVPEDHTILMESHDNGMKWNELGRLGPSGAVHPQLLVLPGGSLLLTYALQEVPRGIFAVLSSDLGKSWDSDHPVYLAGSLASFYGWPTSLQLADSTILTAYTIKGYEETTQINDSVTETVRWQLRGSSGPAIQPLPAQVFAQPHDYRKYPSAVTGFTGGDLQQVSYWNLAEVERNYIPGYKGVMSRFPDGEILVTPFQNDCTVIYRSSDEGRSWQKVEMKGEKILGKEQSIICLRDNKTVLLQTEAKGSPLFRSADRGVTWNRVDYGESTGTTRNFIELSDGSVLMFGSAGAAPPSAASARNRSWRLRSIDGGRTWPERKAVATWDSSESFFSEVFILPFSDTHLLAATRVEGHLARRIAKAPPIGIGLSAGGETDECMVLMDSHDGGLTWSNFRTFLGYSAVHVHMLKLTDGRLLSVFRRRFLPYGVGAVLSDDNGKTWDLANPIIVGVQPTCYGGWPTSLQLEDSTILTTRAWMIWPDAIFEAARWKVPPRVGREAPLK